MGRAKVVSFINYKGGVGKTTTTYHVGCSLAYHHGKKVLLVDADPQTNLTFLCKDYHSWQRFKAHHGTIATLYKKFQKGRTLDTKRYIWPDPIGTGAYRRVLGLDLIPCDLELLGEDLIGLPPENVFHRYDNPFQQARESKAKEIKQWMFLKTVLEEVSMEYDYILIDCPPNLYAMTQNALVASDWYVVTTIPEYLSVIGLQILQRKVRGIRERVTKTAVSAGVENISVAELGGIIFTKVRIGGALITQQHEAQMNEVKGAFPGRCFSTYTTELIGYSEAAERRLPVWLVDTPNARHAAAKAQYEQITEEFLERFP